MFRKFVTFGVTLVIGYVLCLYHVQHSIENKPEDWANYALQKQNEDLGEQV